MFYNTMYYMYVYMYVSPPSFSSGPCSNVDIYVLYVPGAVMYVCLLTVDFCGSNKGSLICRIITVCKCR